jgi:hypothetical protein
MPRSALFVPVAALCLCLAGCGYRLGPASGVRAGEKTVRVLPFANQTLEPRLADAVTMQLRKQLQRDGTFALASKGESDLLVSGVVLRYDRHELSFVPNDVVTVKDYRVSMTAQVTAREPSTGKVLLDRPVTGQTLIRVGSDLVAAERQALPLLAADLARNVTALLVEGTW